MTAIRTEDAARIAARQHGLITRAQALGLGYPRSAIQAYRTSGRWRTVERGVYAINGAPRTWQQRVLAVCLAFGAVASHRTAAVLLGVGGFQPGPVEVTVRNGTKLARAGSRVHEAKDFGLIEPVMIDGIPTTPPARLAVDLGSVTSYERYEATIDQLLVRRDVTWDDLFDVLMSHARRGRNGVGALRALLEERYRSAIGDSPLEQWFLRELRRRGFPEPVVQRVIDDRDGRFVARVDVAFDPELIAVELDSIAFHLNRTSLTKDARTRNRLRRLGWFVLEVTFDMMVNHADEVFGDLRALLTERAGAASTPDPGPADGSSRAGRA